MVPSDSDIPPPNSKDSTRARYHRGYFKQLGKAERRTHRRGEGRGIERQRGSRWQYDEDDDFTPTRSASRRAKPPAKPDRKGTVETRDVLVVGTSRQAMRVVELGLDDPAMTEPETLQLVPGAERPIVGDELEVCPRGRIVARAERRSRLARPDPQRPHRELVLAANVDLGVVVVAAANPAFKPGLVDRALVALERGGVQPMVCITKADLVGPIERAAIEEHLDLWRALEVPTAWTSATSGAGFGELQAALAGRTCVLVGHSGVGKTTLLNRLDPTRERATGEGRTHDGKGRHTTTAAELAFLPGGTRLIDTPGVRAFGLSQSGALIEAFPDLVAAASGCRFRDCAHAGEDGCALAGTDDPVVARRFAIFQRLRASE